MFDIGYFKPSQYLWNIQLRTTTWRLYEPNHSISNCCSMNNFKCQHKGFQIVSDVGYWGGLMETPAFLNTGKRMSDEPTLYRGTCVLGVMGSDELSSGMPSAVGCPLFWVRANCSACVRGDGGGPAFLFGYSELKQCNINFNLNFT